MPKQAQHTIVRFSLRSLLAITFGVALVMAVLGRYIRALEESEQQKLLIILVLTGIGMATRVVFIVLRRKRHGKQCGPLLLTLALQSERKRLIYRWLWLLIFFPGFVWLCFEFTNPDPKSWKDLVSVAIPPISYGVVLADLGLKAWAENCEDAIHFCENGLLCFDQFLSWSSEKIKYIHWSTSDEIAVTIQRQDTNVKVPPHQREAVNAILEAYYKPNRPDDYRSKLNVRRR